MFSLFFRRSKGGMAAAGADASAVVPTGTAAVAHAHTRTDTHSRANFRVLYSSDNHGNNHQYAKLVEYAIANCLDAVILGGDISPKCQYRREPRYYERMCEEQAAWIRGPFAAELRKLAAVGIPCYIIVGNGDVSANYDAHLENEAAGLCRMCDCTRVHVCTHAGVEYNIVGLPYVPFTYSTMKDFELHDVTPSMMPTDRKHPLHRMAWAVAHNGESYFGSESRHVPMHSRPQRRPADFRLCAEAAWRPVEYRPERAEDISVQKVLAAPPFRTSTASSGLPSEERLILIAHAPPFGTGLDMCFARHDGGVLHCEWCSDAYPSAEPHVHCGSAAVREYIEAVRPHITLHGHIHESAIVAGTCLHRFRHTGGAETFSFTSGNDPLYTADGGRFSRRAEVPVGKSVWGVVFDIFNPEAEAIEL